MGSDRLRGGDFWGPKSASPAPSLPHASSPWNLAALCSFSEPQWVWAHPDQEVLAWALRSGAVLRPAGWKPR